MCVCVCVCARAREGPLELGGRDVVGRSWWERGRGEVGMDTYWMYCSLTERLDIGRGEDFLWAWSVFSVVLTGP